MTTASCLQEYLSKALDTCKLAVPRRPTLTILTNVLVQLDERGVTLITSDLEKSISVRVGGQVEGVGAVAVPAAQFRDTVKALPHERIDMELEETALVLMCAGRKMRIPGVTAADWPPTPAIAEGVPVTFDAQGLRRAIEYVKFVAATEESRPVLTGIKADLVGDGFTFATADGFRLAVYKSKLPANVDADVSVIIPAAVLAIVARVIGKKDGVVDCIIGGNSISFYFRGITLLSHLIMGSYPNYNQLIPEKYDNRVVVDQEAFLAAVKGASPVANDGSGIIRLHITGGPMGRLVVSAHSDSVGTYEEGIDAKVEGEGAKIAFNSKYLVEALGVLGKGEVALETTTPSSPGVLRPLQADYVHVIMPMFVQW